MKPLGSRGLWLHNGGGQAWGGEQQAHQQCQLLGGRRAHKQAAAVRAAAGPPRRQAAQQARLQPGWGGEVRETGGCAPTQTKPKPTRLAHAKALGAHWGASPSCKATKLGGQGMLCHRRQAATYNTLVPCTRGGARPKYTGRGCITGVHAHAARLGCAPRRTRKDSPPWLLPPALSMLARCRWRDSSAMLQTGGAGGQGPQGSWLQSRRAGAAGKAMDATEAHDQGPGTTDPASATA